MRQSVNFQITEYRHGEKVDYDDMGVGEEGFHIEFEYTAFPELIADLERTMYEICKAYLESRDMYALRDEGDNPLGTEVVVTTVVCGIAMEARDTLTEDYYKKKKKQDLNVDSLKNDIQYTNTILASAGDVRDDEINIGITAPHSFIREARKWIYHIMNKHFDEPIPEGFEPDAPVEAKPVDKR